MVPEGGFSGQIVPDDFGVFVLAWSLYKGPTGGRGGGGGGNFAFGVRLGRGEEEPDPAESRLRPPSPAEGNTCVPGRCSTLLQSCRSVARQFFESVCAKLCPHHRSLPMSLLSVALSNQAYSEV